MRNPFQSFRLKIGNPFRALKQQVVPRFLGVDIGTTSIKMVEVDQGERLPRLLNYAVLESRGSLGTANLALQTSSLKLFEDEAVNLLRAAVEKMKPKTDAAIATLPVFSAFTTVLTLPAMSDADLQKNLVYQAKQYIPLPISEVALDWLRVGEYEDEKGAKQEQVLLLSVPQAEIKKYQGIFKEAGLALQVLEIEALSLVRAAVGADPVSTVIVDIGNRSSAIAIAEKGQLKYVGQSDFAGAALTQAVASSLNINPLRAEELKREKGISGAGPDYELSTIMLPFMDAIINEVKRVEFNYQSQFPAAAKIERVVLAGGGANLPGIEKYVSQELGRPAVKAAPLLRFEYPSVLEPLVPELNPLLAVALGATLREFT
jgi:type IV pilus assembly protein PilM